MTIEDFDKVSSARQIIKQIDAILKYFDESSVQYLKTNIKGVGIEIQYDMIVPTTTEIIEDEVLIEQFKEMLINRKKQLIEENFNIE